MSTHFRMAGLMAWALFFLLVSNAFADLTVGNYTLVSSKRVTRTEYEYTYRADVTNSGDDVKNVIAKLVSNTPNTSVVEGTLEFGEVNSSKTVSSSDTFIIKHNRQYLLDWALLKWDISYEKVIAGVDADNNGVWDYIDQGINTKYPGADNAQIRAALRQFAQATEGALLNADNKDMSLRYATDSARAMECVWYLRPQDASEVLSNLEASILNTMTRCKQFLKWNEQLAGQVFPSTPFSQRGDSCVAE